MIVTMKRFRALSQSVLVAIIGLQLASSVPLAFASTDRQPHLPTEREVKDRERGTRHTSDGRGYQAHSSETFMAKTRRAASWVKDRLAAIHITPARLALGLGGIGVILSWSRNKKLAKWAVITGFSWLLLIFGGAAVLLQWPYVN